MASINKVTWQRVGNVTSPGRYPFKFGWLTISDDDLHVWQVYPTAVFTLVKVINVETFVDEFRLGTFDLQGTARPSSASARQW